MLQTFHLWVVFDEAKCSRAAFQKIGFYALLDFQIYNSTHCQGYETNFIVFNGEALKCSASYF